MAKFLLLLLLCVTTALVQGLPQNARTNTDPSQALAICAAEDSDSVLVAHEDCSKFYKCFKGNPVPIDCPSGLLYNAEKEFCDWPFNVKCPTNFDILGVGNEAESKNNRDAVVSLDNRGNSDPSKAEEICAGEGSNGILVAHEECNKFYECSKGRPIALKCPPGLLYNPDREFCDWPGNVKCPEVSQEIAEIFMERSSDQAKDTCAAEGSEGKLVAHEECNKFYQCSGGLPVAFECPDDLLFNPDKNICDWPGNVSCSK